MYRDLSQKYSFLLSRVASVHTFLKPHHWGYHREHLHHRRPGGDPMVKRSLLEMFAASIDVSKFTNCNLELSQESNIVHNSHEGPDLYQ